MNQIRYGLSPLKMHLFTFNLNENPFCPTCLENVESTEHYFFICPTYIEARNNLMNKLENITVSFNLTSSILDLSNRNRESILNLLLYGVDQKTDLHMLINKLIYISVTMFFLESRRFTSGLY